MSGNESNDGQREQRSRANGTARLRDATPSRRTPGKSSARDPAMASFDTDDEAAGHPASPEAVARAAAEEAVPHEPPKYPREKAGGSPAKAIFAALAVLVALALVLVVLTTR
jgi:hypothetical protein